MMANRPSPTAPTTTLVTQSLMSAMCPSGPFAVWAVRRLVAASAGLRSPRLLRIGALPATMKCRCISTLRIRHAALNRQRLPWRQCSIRSVVSGLNVNSAEVEALEQARFRIVCNHQVPVDAGGALRSPALRADPRTEVDRWPVLSGVTKGLSPSSRPGRRRSGAQCTGSRRRTACRRSGPSTRHVVPSHNGASTHAQNNAKQQRAAEPSNDCRLVHVSPIPRRATAPEGDPILSNAARQPPFGDTHLRLRGVPLP